jgi:hypothetical protein
VRGPVLAPPCIRHLLFFIAGALQGVPSRMRAPHGFALAKSPEGFPFRSHPRRIVWGASLIFGGVPSALYSAPCLHTANAESG